MWSEFLFGKIEFLPQRSLQNLRVNAINKHGYRHLFTYAMKFISLVFVKYCPALDENLEARVQNISLGNNQVATKFTFCHQFLKCSAEKFLLQCCRWESSGWGLRWGWIQGRVRGRPQPPVVSCPGGLHFLPVPEPAARVEITFKSETTGEQSAMQWYLSLFLHMGDNCW